MPIAARQYLQHSSLFASVGSGRPADQPDAAPWPTRETRRRQAHANVLRCGAGGSHDARGELDRFGRRKVDLSGHRTVITDFGLPSAGPTHVPQPRGKVPSCVAVGLDGTVYVVDKHAHGRGVLFAVDPTTGLRRVLSDF